jgi:hypothetical protein
MHDDKLNQFNLVGGTALALISGHRKSIDIDLFSTTDFESEALSQHLSANYNVDDLHAIKNGVFCFIDNIKTDLLAHQYPLIAPVNVQEGIRMVSLEDIGAMKLSAI